MWYVLSVISGKEQDVREGLERQGYIAQVFKITRTFVHARTKKVMSKDVVAFSGYVFVKVGKEWPKLDRITGPLGWLKNERDGDPVAVTEDEIVRLNEGLVFDVPTGARVGDRITISLFGEDRTAYVVKVKKASIVVKAQLGDFSVNVEREYEPVQSAA